MEINLSDKIKQIISIFVLIILPLLLLGIVASIDYIQQWYYYLILITWFGLGVIFYSVTK